MDGILSSTRYEQSSSPWANVAAFDCVLKLYVCRSMSCLHSGFKCKQCSKKYRSLPWQLWGLYVR